MPIFMTELFPGISELFELLTVMKSNGQITKLRNMDYFWQPPWSIILPFYQNQLSQMFFKLGVSKNLTLFTGKHLCWGLFSKRDSCKYCKILRQFFYRAPLVPASVLDIIFLRREKDCNNLNRVFSV